MLYSGLGMKAGGTLIQDCNPTDLRESPSSLKSPVPALPTRQAATTLAPTSFRSTSSLLIVIYPYLKNSVPEGGGGGKIALLDVKPQSLGGLPEPIWR